MIGTPYCVAARTFAEERTTPAAPESVASASGEAMPKLAANIPPLSKTTTQIIVSLAVNKEARGDFFAELDETGGLYLKVEDLLALNLGFEQDRAILINNEKFAPLNAVRDVTFTFDEKKLTVDILGMTTERRHTSIELIRTHAKRQNVRYPRETSAFLNYGLTYAYTDQFGFQSFSASNKLGGRAGDVFFVSDSLYTETPTEWRFVRLATNATYERRGALQWVVLGDQVASPGDLGSSINMGGIGFSKVFRLDPYYITQPFQSIRGVTQFPAQAAVYMDGVLLGKHSVAPGSFELKNIYSYGGAHTVEVLLTDPFGNEQRISYPMYFSPQLLREGNHEYSYNAGFQREQFGVKSDEYGKPAFSAFHRFGATSTLTLGARAEGSDNVSNGGLFTSFALPRAGSFTFSLAGSSANGQSGSAGSFQHSYQFGSFNTDLQVRGFSRAYATVSVPATPDMAKFHASLAGGFLIPSLGGISLGYSQTETYDEVTTRVTSASYSRGLTKEVSLSAIASATRVIDTTYSFFIGLNFTPARNVHGAVQVSRTADTITETLQLQKDMPIGEGVGYRATVTGTDTGDSIMHSINPSVQYNAKYGTYALDSAIRVSGGDTTELYNISAAGSLVYAGGFFGLSRPVSDSFGIVMVDNVAGASVLNNGLEIGQTDSSGKLVVPTLVAYNENQISLDLKNMPMDYRLSEVRATIAPSLWSGSCVAFDAVKVRAVTGILYTMTEGKKMPMEFVELIMNVGDREVISPTGKGGEFYIENVFPEEPKAGAVDKQSCRAIAEHRKTGGDYIRPGIYSAWIDLEGGRCKFSILFPETEDVIAEIGEVECIMSGK